MTSSSLFFFFLVYKKKIYESFFLDFKFFQIFIIINLAFDLHVTLFVPVLIQWIDGSFRVQSVIKQINVSSLHLFHEFNG